MAPETASGRELLRAVETAPDDVSFAQRLLDFVAFHEPEMRENLAGGMSLVDALVVSEHGDSLCCIRDPKDLADLARKVTEHPAPFGWEAEPGETPEEFDRAMKKIGKAGQRRAVALLESALEIVKEAIP